MATPRPKPPNADIPRSTLPSFKRTPEGKPAPLTGRIKALAAEGAPPPMRGSEAFREKLGVLPIQDDQMLAAVGLLDRVLTGDVRLDELSGVNQWLVQQAAEIYYKGTKTADQLRRLGPDPDYVPGTLTTLDSLTGNIAPDAPATRTPPTPEQLESTAQAHEYLADKARPQDAPPDETAADVSHLKEVDSRKIDAAKAEYEALAASPDATNDQIEAAYLRWKRISGERYPSANPHTDSPPTVDPDESAKAAALSRDATADENRNIAAAEALNTERQAMESALRLAEQSGQTDAVRRLRGELEHDIPAETAQVQGRLRTHSPADEAQAMSVAEWVAAKQDLFKEIEAARGRGDTDHQKYLELKLQDLIAAQPGKGRVREGAVADFDTAGTEPAAVAEVTPYERGRKAEDLRDLAAAQRTSNAAAIRNAIREQGLNPIGETVATDAAGNPLPEVQHPPDRLTLRDHTEGWERPAVRNRREPLGSSIETLQAEARMDAEAGIAASGRKPSPAADLVDDLELEPNPNDELLDTTPVTVVRMGTRVEGGDPLQSTAKTFVTYDEPTRDPKQPFRSVPVKANSVHAGGYVYLQTEGGGYYRVPVTEGATKAEKLSQSQWATGLREAMGQEGGARPDVTTVNDVNRYFQLESNRQSALNRNLGDLLEDRVYAEDVNHPSAWSGSRIAGESNADFQARRQRQKAAARYERTKSWNQSRILKGLQETFFSKQLADQAMHPPGKAIPEPAVAMPAPMRLLGNNPISDDAFEGALLRTNNRLANGEPVEPSDIAIITDYRSAHPEDFENMVGMIRNSTESQNADYLLAQAHTARYRGEGLAYKDFMERFGSADRNVLDESRLYAYLNDYGRVRQDLARLLEADELAPTPANLRAAELLESTYEAPGSPSDPPLDLDRLQNMRARAYSEYERAIPDARASGLGPSSPQLMAFQRDLQGAMGKRGLKNIGILGHLESRSGASRNLGAVNKLRENAFLLEDPTLDPLKRRALEAENQRIIAKLEASFDSRVSQGEAAALQALRFAEAPDRHRASSGIEQDPDEAIREGLGEVGEAMRRGDQAEFSSPSEAPGGGPDSSPGFTEGFASMLGNPAQREYLAGTMFSDPNRNSRTRRMMYRLYLRSGLGQSGDIDPVTGVAKPMPYLSVKKIPVNDINRAFDKIDSINDELAAARMSSIGGLGDSPGSIRRGENNAARIKELEGELSYWQSELEQIEGFRKNYDDFQAMLDEALTTDTLKPASDVMESPEVQAKAGAYKPAKPPTLGEKMNSLRAALVDAVTAPRELELPTSKSTRYATGGNTDQFLTSYKNAADIDYDRGRLLLDAFRELPDADTRDIHRMRRKVFKRPEVYEGLLNAERTGVELRIPADQKEQILREIAEARRWAQAKANGGRLSLGEQYSPSEPGLPQTPGQFKTDEVTPPDTSKLNPYEAFDRELENAEKIWSNTPTVIDTYTGGANLGEAAKDFKLNRTATGSLVPLTNKPDLAKYKETSIEQPVFVDPNNTEAMEAMRLLTGESYIGENAFRVDPAPEGYDPTEDIQRVLRETGVSRLAPGPEFAADNPNLLNELQKAAADPGLEAEDAAKFTKAAEFVESVQYPKEKPDMRSRLYEGAPIGPDSYSMGKPMRLGEKLVIPINVAIPASRGGDGVIQGYQNTIYIPASYDPIATPGGRTASFSLDPNTKTFRKAAFAGPESPVPEFSEGAKIIGSDAPREKVLLDTGTGKVVDPANVESVTLAKPQQPPSRMRRLVDAASSVVPSGRTTARVAGAAGAAGLGLAGLTALNDYLNPVEAPPVDQNRIRRLVEESVADQVYTNDPARHKKVMTTQVPLAGKIGL